MVRKVHGFLVDVCGMTDISERVIRSPSARDFITIFECIYQHHDTDFRIKGKIEEEVGLICRNRWLSLGTPYFYETWLSIYTKRFELEDGRSSPCLAASTRSTCLARGSCESK